MTRYVYQGDDDPRIYPTVPITVSPGDIAELDAPLDDSWVEAPAKDTAVAVTPDNVEDVVEAPQVPAGRPARPAAPATPATAFPPVATPPADTPNAS